jgi:alginate O-acetyltransferase complex protein AlgI
VAVIADAAFGAGVLYPVAAWLGVFAYAFQIYFDFSGYSDMAIGLGLMLGFEFPRNFDAPYKSRSITEFWRRWHITLSAWLRDYLYIPLGGNRKGAGRTYANLLIVMLLGGLWHGAAWKFVIWGGIHGAWLAWERLTSFDKLTRIPSLLRVTLTFVIVNIAWVFFRADHLPAALNYLRSMFSSRHDIPPTEILVRATMYTPQNLAWMATAAAIAFFGVQTWDLAKKITPWRAAAAILLLVWAIRMLTLRASTPFLYFQF